MYKTPSDDPNWVAPATKEEAMAAMAGHYAHCSFVAYDGETPNGPLATLVVSYGFTDLVIENGELVAYDKLYHAENLVPVHVRSSFNDNPGTMVVKEDAAMEKVVVSGIAYNKQEAKITITRVADRPGIAAMLFGRVAEANIVVDMIVQNISQDGSTDISFTVPKTDAKKISEVMKKVVAEIGAKGVSVKEDIAKVSIIGVGMRSHSGVASKMFSAMAKDGINIMMISTSEIQISIVIDAKYTELAVRTLHETFEMDKAA